MRIEASLGQDARNSNPDPLAHGSWIGRFRLRPQTNAHEGPAEGKIGGTTVMRRRPGQLDSGLIGPGWSGLGYG